MKGHTANKTQRPNGHFEMKGHLALQLKKKMRWRTSVCPSGERKEEEMFIFDPDPKKEKREEKKKK
jgi:hypothetical protein